MISRRSVTIGLGAIPLHFASARTVLSQADTLATVENAVRVNSDLDPQQTAPWWYVMRLYAIQPGKAPLLMVEAEGCEHVFTRREPDGSYRMRNGTVSAFKDIVTGRWLDQYQNPITGRQNTVRTNVIEGGSTLFSADGRDVLRDNTGMKSSQLPGAHVSPKPARIGGLAWQHSGNRVAMIKDGTASGAYQPFMEVGTYWVDRLALKRKTSRVEADFTSSFLSPWLGWMDMADQPGHLLWHSSGRKLSSLGELPRTYRDRAEDIAPGVLSRNPFETAIS